MRSHQRSFELFQRAKKSLGGGVPVIFVPVAIKALQQVLRGGAGSDVRECAEGGATVWLAASTVNGAGHRSALSEAICGGEESWLCGRWGSTRLTWHHRDLNYLLLKA